MKWTEEQLFLAMLAAVQDWSMDVAIHRWPEPIVNLLDRDFQTLQAFAA
jgi:hypothetical protein